MSDSLVLGSNSFTGVVPYASTRESFGQFPNQSESEISPRERSIRNFVSTMLFEGGGDLTKNVDFGTEYFLGENVVYDLLNFEDVRYNDTEIFFSYLTDIATRNDLSNSMRNIMLNAFDTLFPFRDKLEGYDNSEFYRGVNSMKGCLKKFFNSPYLNYGDRLFKIYSILLEKDILAKES